MIPAAPAAGAATAQPVTSSSSARAAVQASPETTRTSAGEAAPSNIKLATANAVTAPKQTVVAPRLRDEETAERSERAIPSKDSPTGPPPTFEESPLERQARVAFDPPDAQPTPASDVVAGLESEQREDDIAGPYEASRDAARADPPPTPTERAEASFAETRMIAEPQGRATVDVEL